MSFTEGFPSNGSVPVPAYRLTRKLLVLGALHHLVGQQLQRPPRASCWRVRALDRDELNAYLAHRLRLAGCELPLFEPPAVEALSQSTRGLPRLINRIAHYALTAAAAKGARNVTAEHLEHAVAELRL